MAEPLGEPPEPDRLVVVLGTATEVGKTWVAARLLEGLRACGVSVSARKPAQSFEPNGREPTDADVLADATGEDPADVCPAHRWYPAAMAPPMAADVLGGAKIPLTELISELEWPPGIEVGVVESVGGVRSPLAHDGDNVDLVAALAPDHVVLVADAGLGTINAVRLAVGALAPPEPLVVLNRYDPGDELHHRNRAWLEGDGLAVLTDMADVVATVRRS